MCKNVKSDNRYVNAYLHEKEQESVACEIIEEIVQMFCTSGLSIARVKCNIEKFRSDHIKHVFNKFIEQKRKSVESLKFLRTLANCAIICVDEKYEESIYPICSSLYAAYRSIIDSSKELFYCMEILASLIFFIAILFFFFFR